MCLVVTGLAHAAAGQGSRQVQLRSSLARRARSEKTAVSRGASNVAGGEFRAGLAGHALCGWDLGHELQDVDVIIDMVLVALLRGLAITLFINVFSPFDRDLRDQLTATSVRRLSDAVA